MRQTEAKLRRLFWALIVATAVLGCVSPQALAQATGTKGRDRPVLFLANESLPPMSFLKKGKPTGIVIDLAEAMIARMHHRARVRLMNWAKAQRLVLEGRADGLLQINPSPERLKIFDFSTPLLTSQFAIFTNYRRSDIRSLDDLPGLTVGVEIKGLPVLLLKNDPRITTKPVGDVVQGFNMLAAGQVDAIVLDRWVGGYVLAQQKMRGVRIAQNPISQSDSAIAVKKGNTDLLEDIDAALNSLRRDGTYDRIIQTWRPHEVVFETREQLHKQALMTTVMFLGWIVTLGGVIVLVKEIRRRRRVETMLRESRDELDHQVRERTKELVQATEELRDKAEIIDLVHDAVIVLDCEARITFWSRGAEETYGFPPEQALGQVSHELLKTAFPAAIEEIEKTVVEKGEWKGELTHRKAGGEPIVVDSRWAVNIGREGKPAGFLEVNRDITARKMAEEKLRKADRAFKALSECNQAMVRQTEEMELFGEVCRIMVETGGYRMAWVGFAENDAQKSVQPIVCAGYDEGYLARANLTWADNERGRGPCGTSIRTGKMSISQNALTNPAFVPWLTEAQKRGYASSVSLPLIVENRVIGAFTVYASEADAFDEEEANLLSKLAGNISYGVEAMRVAKERLRSEKELRVYASRLETINAELQEFAFVASHDLQEPLRKIQTFCDLATKNRASGLGTKTEDYLERIADSAGRMRQLLRDLLEFSRIASGAQSFTRIDLTETAREAAAIFEAMLPETGCEIAIHDLPAIEADRSQMLHLFQNLIGNSLKYRKDTAVHIEIRGEVKGDFCEICVKDNGIGFEQQYCGLIFKPFQRLHKRDEYSGSGMGLAICRKIVERHGGAISGRGEPVEGAVFTVRLPLKQARLESIIAARL